MVDKCDYPEPWYPSPVRLVLYVALCASLAAVAWTASTSTARADGGAPNLAYVVAAGSDGGDVDIIDIARRQLTRRIRVGGNPQAIVLSVDSRYAYVTQAASNTLAVIDARTLRVIATVPAGNGPGAMALSAVKLNLYIVDTLGNAVTVFDLNRQRVVGRVAVGSRPMGIAVVEPVTDANGSIDAEVYVANTDNDSVSVVSATQGRVIAVIAAPGGPIGVTVPSPGGIAYVSTRAGTILALDLANHRLLGTLLERPGGVFGTMDYDAVTGEIYVPDSGYGVVYVLRPASPPAAGATASLPSEPARTLAFDDGPAAAAITFDGAYLFVAERQAGQVIEYDPTTQRVIATIVVGGQPEAIITGAYPPVQVGPPPNETDPRRGSQSASAGAIVGCGLLVAILIAVGMYLVVRRGGRRQHPGQH